MTLGRITLGSRIRGLREEAELELAMASNEAGISYSYLSDIERGRRLPTLEVLDGIAQALQTSVLGLLSGLYPWDVGVPPSHASPPPDGRERPSDDITHTA